MIRTALAVVGAASIALVVTLCLHAQRVESVHDTLRRAGYDDEPWI